MKSFSSGYQKSVFLSLAKCYRPFFFRIGTLIILGLIGRACLLWNANRIGQWVDAGSPSPSQFLGELGILVVIGFVLTWIFRVGFSRASALAVSSLYDEVTRHASRFPMNFFRERPSGRIITRFSSDYGNVFRLFGGPLAEFLSIITDILLISVLILVASPSFWPLLVLMWLTYGGVFLLNRQRLLLQRRLLSSRRSPSIAHFAETLMGLGAIRSFQREVSFQKRFEELDLLHLLQKRSNLRLNIGFALQMNTVTALIFLIACGGALWFKPESVSAGDVGVLFGFILLAGNSTQMFFDWLSQFEEALVGVERLDEYLHIDLEPGSQIPSLKLSQSIDLKYASNQVLVRGESPAPPLVEFKNVCFQYLTNNQPGPWVLQNLNFSIRPGEKIGVIGRTGSGKSSLLQLLFHLERPTRGEIRIDERQVSGLSLSKPTQPRRESDWALEDFRALLSYVPQEASLFQASLRENLDLPGLHTDGELLKVLAQVGLSRLASPQSLTLELQEFGRGLSLGERQLLCLARALLQNRPILVLDEATSNVDPQSEERMTQASEELFADRTQIIVAHRLSTLRNVNRVLWLHEGRTQAIGPREEVLAQFRKFVIGQGDVSPTSKLL
ncbi:MAG: ABC transporter ATP-binding protein [Bdellovibrio sp.]